METNIADTGGATNDLAAKLQNPRNSDSPENSPASRVRKTPAPYLDPYLAGIGLGITLLAAFVLVGRGLGASGAFSAIIAWISNGIAPQWTQANGFLGDYVTDESTHPLKTWLVFEVIGVVVGAFISGLLAGRIARVVERGPRVGVGPRLAGAFCGGALMAFGAHLARGCTSGQGLTGGSLLNLGSWIFMMAVFGGAYAVARFLRWQWR